MVTYVIEGTISELRKEVSTKKDSTEKNCNIKIKISGSEGYSVKQDKKKYNVFCPKDMPKEDKSAPCCIADSQFELSIAVDVEYENILTQALVSGKRVRLTIPENILTSAVQSNADESPQDKVTSVTVLSE